MMVKSSLLETI